jgi:ATP-dependent RNA circularization protein (DNA/RNA ligase family)
MKKLVLIAAAGSLALALSACGGSKNDEAPVDTNVSNLETTVNDTVIVNDTSVSVPETNVTTPAARGSDFTNTAQTQDDAEATGMTSRVSRDDDNSTTPTH